MPTPLDLDAVSLEDLKKLVVQLMVEVTALREENIKVDRLAAVASMLHGCAGWRKGRPVSMLRILPSCRTNTMLTVATTFRGRSDA